MNPVSSIKKMFRLLFFRISREEMLRFDRTDLAFGLIITWIVGIGRYWDDPGAKLLQHLGVGSVVYVFVLSFFIWILLKPFYIKQWSFTNLLTFVTLTSAPAILYAIPVERFYSFNIAASINAYFLLAVAIWRVALLVFYYRRYAGLTRFETTVATLLPLTIIVAGLTALNLERAVFSIMGGIREKTSNDFAYKVLILLSLLSFVALVPTFIGYLVIGYKKFKERRLSMESPD